MIVGGVVGGVAALIAVVLVFYWLRRHRPTQQVTHPEGFSASESTKYEGTTHQPWGPPMHSLPYQGQQWNPQPTTPGVRMSTFSIQLVLTIMTQLIYNGPPTAGMGKCPPYNLSERAYLCPSTVGQWGMQQHASFPVPPTR